jgi:hypothetical protein
MRLIAICARRLLVRFTSASAVHIALCACFTTVQPAVAQPVVAHPAADPPALTDGNARTPAPTDSPEFVGIGFGWG